ncbi:MAG: hypothetical protein P8100_06650 [bacterium]
MKTIKKHIIKGEVVSEQNGKGIPDLRIEAWDKDLIIDDLLGSTTTDSEGKFEIHFDEVYHKELFMDYKPDIYFKIFLKSELVKSTENAVLWNTTSFDKTIVIEVDLL